MDYSKLFSRCITQLQKRIDSDDFLEQYREPRHFIRRSRKLSIRQIVYYLFETSKAAMGLNLSELPRIFPEIGFPSVSRQAVSKARAGIMPELFETLFNDSVETYLNDPSGPSTKWASGTFAILAVDGSKVQLPNHDTIFETFGFIPKKKRMAYDPAPGENGMGLVSTLYSVSDDVIVDAIISHYAASERSLALEHLYALKALMPPKLLQKVIVIFDRGYYGAAFIREIKEKIGCHFVIRCKDCSNWCKDMAASGSTDTTVQIAESNDKKAKPFPVRALHLQISDEVDEFLVTDLDNPDYTLSDFIDLYFRRWPIETKYNEIKNNALVEEFAGYTAHSIKQEFYISMLLVNLASFLKQAADKRIEEDTCKKDNKLKYVANRKFAYSKLKKCILELLVRCRKNLNKFIDYLISEVAKQKSAVRPGRKFSRQNKKKSWMRSHFNNRKPTS